MMQLHHDSRRVYLMQTGHIVFSGSNREISFEELRQTYFGRAVAG